MLKNNKQPYGTSIHLMIPTFNNNSYPSQYSHDTCALVHQYID